MERPNLGQSGTGMDMCMEDTTHTEALELHVHPGYPGLLPGDHMVQWGCPVPTVNPHRGCQGSSHLSRLLRCLLVCEWKLKPPRVVGGSACGLLPGGLTLGTPLPNRTAQPAARRHCVCARVGYERHSHALMSLFKRESWAPFNKQKKAR